ncbi:MAG TPA: hypothetical protein DGQ94_14885 [Pseudomonas sp.]|nr:hypothetical protein [Pseudomonas sp.]
MRGWIRRSSLARSSLELRAACFAGMPAPTGYRAAPEGCAIPVGAGEPAKGPALTLTHSACCAMEKYCASVNKYS